jgi:hypothetical protein
MPSPEEEINTENTLKRSSASGEEGAVRAGKGEVLWQALIGEDPIPNVVKSAKKTQKG